MTDDRGSFVRTWCQSTMADHGIDMSVIQSSVSVNGRRGTLRGLHLQAEPHGERKLVRCIRGRLFDVVVDLRADSSTYRQWCAFDLNGDDDQLIYIPAGCAHGFLTLEDDTRIEYMMGEPYVADAAIGIRWDDPAVSIAWPCSPEVISQRDQHLPLLDEMS